MSPYVQFKGYLKTKNYVEAFICIARMVKAKHRYSEKADRDWMKAVYQEPNTVEIITKSEEELWKRYKEETIYRLYDVWDKIPPLKGMK